MLESSSLCILIWILD